MKPDFGLTNKRFYMDNAATTFMDERVVEAMMPYLEERYGNPESLYALGSEASDAVEAAREEVARLIGVKRPDRVFFTSGGTEANNWAVKGSFLIHDAKVAVSSVEHASVLESARWLAKTNYVTGLVEIPVDGTATVSLAALEDALKAGGVRLVSVQWVNNEVGTIQPMAEVASLCKKYGALCHCDAVQAFGKIRLNTEQLGIDMVSVSSHKIHGPMGAGALYVREGVDLEPLLHGGQQEGSLRAGTHGVAGIAGFGKAAELAWTSIGIDGPAIKSLSDRLRSILKDNLRARLNGHPENRIPHIVSATIPGIEASLVCGILDNDHGVCVSKGSACSRGQPSHVLSAMGFPKSDCNSTLRFSVGKYNKSNEAEIVCGLIQKAAAKARGMGLV